MDAYLNEYSRRFLKFLEREAPELHRAMRPVIDKEGKYTGFLEAEMVAPDQSTAVPLRITTDDDEVTVSFDAFHAHFGSEDSEEESFAKAIVLVRNIMTERVSVASWWKDEKWVGSRLVEAGVSAERPPYVDSTAALRVRSWKAGQKK